MASVWGLSNHSDPEVGYRGSITKFITILLDRKKCERRPRIFIFVDIMFLFTWPWQSLMNPLCRFQAVSCSCLGLWERCTTDCNVTLTAKQSGFKLLTLFYIHRQQTSLYSQNRLSWNAHEALQYVRSQSYFQYAKWETNIVEHSPVIVFG